MASSGEKQDRSLATAQRRQSGAAERRRIREEQKAAALTKRDADGRLLRPVLNPRHLDVVNRYYENGKNKREAMKFCGYPPSMQKNAHLVFNRPDVVAEIAWRDEQIQRRYEVTEERIVRELARIAFGNLPDILDKIRTEDGRLDLSLLDENEKAMISEFVVEEFTEGRGEEAVSVRKTKIKQWDKVGALDRLMRYMGLYKDNAQVNVQVNVWQNLQEGRNRVAKLAREGKVIEGEATSG